MTSVVSGGGRGGEQIVQSRGFEWFARAGFVARGLIYGIIGVLAVKLAVGHGGKTTNQQGALHTIADQPFGKTLLVIVAIGLGGYAFWRIVRALLGHGPEARDSAVERVAGFASGLVYAGICVLAIGIIGVPAAEATRVRRRQPRVSSAGPAGSGSSASRVLC